MDKQVTFKSNCSTTICAAIIKWEITVGNNEL